MSGTDTAAMVPDVYDVVIDGYGYITARAVEPNLPFRTQSEALSYSPTFVERQNVSNSYGDNAQDFFLTIRQRDWSLGEQQKYFRAGTDGRYWHGTNIDVSTPGQVRLAPDNTAVTFAAAAINGVRDSSTFNVLVSTSTNLYRVDATGTIAGIGAHGLGAAPTKFGAVMDGARHYFTTTAAGTVGIRSWDNASFATFSATAADSLAFVNNTLYGYRSTNNDLVQYDTAGTATTIFTWKNAVGGATKALTGINIPAMAPYGGKLLICFPYAQEGCELWLYDGAGVSRLAVFPFNFVATDLEILYGVVYVGGNFYRAASGSTWYPRPAVMFYDGTEIGRLWQADDYASSTVSNQVTGPGPALGVYDGRLLFTDDTMNTMLAYNPATGGVSTVGSYTSGGTDAVIVSSNSLSVHVRNRTAATYFPSATSYATSGTVISSLIDFDSSLPKQFRGVKVEFDAASDGDGGTVDIAYQVDSLTGSWTTLKTGAASGTEYTFSSVSGHAIAIRITLNKSTSTAGPVLRSMNVRGAPALTSYRINGFIFDLGGDTPDQNPVKRRDGSDHTLTGDQMRQNLAAAIQATSPIQVTDRTGTYTAVLEPDGCEFDRTRPNQWYAQIKIREV